MLYMSLVVDLIGQRSRDVIGRLSASRDVIGCEDCKETDRKTQQSLYDMTPGFKPFTTE